ncbi:MAG: M48 family metalloprotease [Anaerolineaceae bacterium]|nr:M48 family metalloprotease [Anaerolineaceae bacterium]
MYGNNPSQNRLYPQQQRSGGCLRIGIALAVAAFAIISFMGSKVYNPVTGQDQYISITQEQEIALGIQAAPEMAAEFGGLEPDEDYQTVVQYVGNNIVSNSEAAQSNYPFEFHVLADQQTVNAFALPGGQVFITRALMDNLESEGQLAGVLSHEIMHVLARHGAERIAEAQLAEGLTGALVLATYDPNDPGSMHTAQVALLISQLVQMKFGRDDELTSDTFGVDLMSQAGYDPNQMVTVMKILEASGGSAPIEFFSTHPSPENRIGRIQAAIAEKYPNGVPSGMIQ